MGRGDAGEGAGFVFVGDVARDPDGADHSTGRVVPAPGGVLIRDAGGAVIGAVGISGDVSDKDEACALAGIAAAQLVGDTG